MATIYEQIIDNLKIIKETNEEIINLYIQMSYMGFADRIKLVDTISLKKEKVENYGREIIELLEDAGFKWMLNKGFKGMIEEVWKFDFNKLWRGNH